MSTTKSKKTKKKIEPGSQRISPHHWELFCHLYTGSHTRELFGAGTKCAMIAYKFDLDTQALVEEQQLLENENRLVKATEQRAGEISARLLEIKIKIRQLCNRAESNSRHIIESTKGRARINFLLDKYINDQWSDREIGYVIGQRHDLRAKVMAYEAINKIKNRIANAPEPTINLKWDIPEGWGKQRPPASVSVTVQTKSTKPQTINDILEAAED